MMATIDLSARTFTDGPLNTAALRRECRTLARRRALLAAASSLIPVPGVDLVADLALLTRLIERINTHFGFTEAQIDALSPARQATLYRLMTVGGGTLAARLTTPGLVVAILRRIGIRLTVMEAVRFVPVAGQLAAAAIGYWSFNFVAQRHIRRCEAVQQALSEEGKAASGPAPR